MKTPVILASLSLLFISLTSCSQFNESVIPAATSSGKIQFQYQTFELKNTNKKLSTQSVAANADAIIISIKDNQETVVMDQVKIPLIKMNNTYLSNSISLPYGQYQITEFMVVDDTNNAIYLTPQSNSEKAIYVASPLPVNFSVTQENMSTIAIDVLSTTSQTPESFGYQQFQFNVQETILALFTVAEGSSLTTASISIQNNDITIHSSELAAKTNVIELAASTDSNYIITIQKAPYTEIIQTKTKIELALSIEQPLIFEFTPETQQNTVTILSVDKTAIGYSVDSLESYDGDTYWYRQLNGTNISTVVANQGSSPKLIAIAIPFKGCWNSITGTTDGTLYPTTVLTETSFKIIDVIAQIRDANATPVIDWLPWDTTQTTPTSQLTEITNGSWDTFLIAWATALKDLNTPVIIQWAKESNGTWYPWNTDAQAYQNAFQYVVTLFRTQGATNVQWMFNINNGGNSFGYQYADYFPGTDYVDLLGVTGSNFGTSETWSSWLTFNDLFSSITQELSTLADLPIILETTSLEVGGDKTAWVTDMIDQLTNNSIYNKVNGVIWNQKGKYQDNSWSIDSSTTAVEAFNLNVQLSSRMESNQ